ANLASWMKNHNQTMIYSGQDWTMKMMTSRSMRLSSSKLAKNNLTEMLDAFGDFLL
ncbi:unnamed protein product, partial [Oikopleura dioica]